MTAAIMFPPFRNNTERAFTRSAKKRERERERERGEREREFPARADVRDFEFHEFPDSETIPDPENRLTRNPEDNSSRIEKPA